MKNNSYLYYFTVGAFLAVALSLYLIPIIILALILILRWGNYMLPIIVALFIDISLVADRDLYGLYGFIFTLPTLIISIILLKLRKFLKV